MFLYHIAHQSYITAATSTNQIRRTSLRFIVCILVTGIGLNAIISVDLVPQKKLDDLHPPTSSHFVTSS
jgi:hypothetical protein